MSDEDQQRLTRD